MYSQTTADSNAIRNILNEETLAWNNGDAQAYSKHFSADGTFTNILGAFFIGHTDFQARHDQVFKGPFRGTTLKQDNVSLRFLKADVAITETLSSVSGFSKDGPPKGANLDEKGRLRTRLLQVIVKKGNAWQIVAYHNVDVKPGVPVPETN
jgi:uncharacterized protein (TIGR02246 family)